VRYVKFIAMLLFSGLALSGFCAAQQSPSANPKSPAAAEDWQRQFDDVCSKTQDAMAFSTVELKALIQQCDALEPQIQKLDETRKKVYLRRLAQCRGLYAYVLDSKQKDKN
jgi:hypothetical protein